ncbi:MAG: bifunctional (p)ppGpp synthetase/guanosine-3',5'-bis(diphosphate) 3'-pyrophosphohydrolase [Ruminococcaceae bacterium]|nr:bifunctional (p)ppGpp synthetase/guanosine-3',5'-bis(diphosphate) 3'-pyrophosphohydrolase [Oscillospiraceae bacterium]
MKLCEQLQGNTQVQAIMAKMTRTSKKQVGDVIWALNKLVETSPRAQTVEQRIGKAYVMCIYTDPLAEDVIAMLLHVAHSNFKASLKHFEEWFYKGKAQKYFQWMVDAFHGISYDARTEKQKEKRTAVVDYNIMKRVCDRMYESLVRTIKSKGIKDTTYLLAAYNLAQKAYEGRLGEMGEPRLAYPISVASILAGAEMDVSVVAAALLYDITNLTDCTIADVESKCNLHVANYVEATVRLHRSFEAIHHRAEESDHPIYPDAKGFQDLVRAIRGDAKLLSALYIKAADRIHRLRLLCLLPDGAPSSLSAGPDYLPLLKKLHLNYFASVIEDLEWRASNPGYYRAITERYEDLLKRNAPYIASTHEDLRNCFVHHTEGVGSSVGMSVENVDVNIFEYHYLSLEVQNLAKESIGLVRPEKINESSVPLCDFDLVVEPAEKVSAFLSLFVKSYLNRYHLTRRTIVDYSVDGYGRFVFVIQDAQGCIFRLCISSQANRDLCRIGYRQHALPARQTKEPSASVGVTIDVYLRNGKRISLPKGACVLDVAFAIHPEVGLATKGATVNGHQANLYDKLRDGDRVVIDADTYRKDGLTKSFVPHVKINWVVFVATDKARRAIAKWCHDNYEVDDSAGDVEASDAAANSAMDSAIAALKGVWDFEQLE